MMAAENSKPIRKRVSAPPISRAIREEEQATAREQQTKRYKDNPSLGRGGPKRSKESIHEENTDKLAALKEEAVALRERLIFLLQTHWTASRYRYRYLESRTGISEGSWQNLFLRRQFPTVEMLIACCEHLPEYALWLMTGHFARPDSVMNLYAQKAPDQALTGEYQQHLEWLAAQASRKVKKA